MNILPKDEIEFAKPDYWDRFFKERGKKGFEWYGEYHELCGELHKYIKPKDAVLVVGCGNSRLSSDLYDVGYREMTNIDISSVVIKQMKEREGKTRPGMSFLQMDALNMDFEPEKFTVVLDKGTLDALMPLDEKDDHVRAENLFSQVGKVLKIGGRYIVISLLQPHILRRILCSFTEMGWMVRIVRCLEVERKTIEETGLPGMPVFMIVCTKLKKIGNVNSVLEANIYVTDNIQRLKSKEEMMIMIDGLQKAVMMLKDGKDETEVEFYQNEEDRLRYLIYVVNDIKDQKLLKKYGAFIVPHGRECEWMFGTKEGRKYLLAESGFDRLSVILLRRDNYYESKTAVQKELDRTILEFAPSFMECDNCGIPYLTIGDYLGQRETVYRVVSEISGEIIVEEVEIDGNKLRRLVFMDNQAVIQSEIKLKKKAKKNKWRIDPGHTPNSHSSYMSIAVSLVKQPKSVLVVGLGGGGLCLFVNKVYPNVSVTGVEIDPVIVKIAHKYFGLKESNSLKIVTGDGLEILKKQEKHDVIMLDVDSKEQGSVMTSPPKQFLEPYVLECVKNSIGNTGIFVMNVVSRIEDVHGELVETLRKYFSLLAWYNMKENVNRIVFMCNKDLSEDEWRDSIIKSAQDLNLTAKKKMEADSVLDIYHFETELSL